MKRRWMIASIALSVLTTNAFAEMQLRDRDADWEELEEEAVRQDKIASEPVSVPPPAPVIRETAAATEVIPAPETIQEEPETAPVQETAINVLETSKDLGSNESTSRFWLFLGASGGGSWLSSGRQEVESDKSGYLLNVKALGSYFFEKAVVDVGAGWFRHWNEGQNLLSSSQANRVRVTTEAFFFEVSPRYRINESFQLGPVVNVLAGRDVGLSEWDDVANLSAFGGIRAQFEFPKWIGKARFGAQLMTDITLPGRQMMWGQLDVQFGLPWDRIKPSSAREPASKGPAVVAYMKRENPTVTAISASKVKIEMNGNVLHFATDSSEIHPSDDALLGKLAGMLTRTQGRWKGMNVQGHADRRGTVEHNRGLSQRRAQAVADRLAELGLSPNKMNVVGFGSELPAEAADTTQAWSLNRRVEIILEGVKNPGKLVKEIDRGISSTQAKRLKKK